MGDEPIPIKRLNSAFIFTAAITVIWAAVNVGVFFVGDTNQISIVIQADIGMVLMAYGYWFGTSKSSTDKDEVTKELLTKGGPNAPATPEVDTKP